jgi:ribosomal protein L5
MTASCNYYINIVRANLLSKHLYNNVYEVPRIEKIILTINLLNNNLTGDLSIINSLCLLELLAIQTAFLRKVKAVYRAKTKKLIFVCVVSLRSLYFYDLLLFLMFVVLPLLSFRYIYRNLIPNYGSNTFAFSFSDMNVLPFVPENFYK